MNARVRVFVRMYARIRVHKRVYIFAYACIRTCASTCASVHVCSLTRMHSYMEPASRLHVRVVARCYAPHARWRAPPPAAALRFAPTSERPGAGGPPGRSFCRHRHCRLVVIIDVVENTMSLEQKLDPDCPRRSVRAARLPLHDPDKSELNGKYGSAFQMTCNEGVHNSECVSTIVTKF